MDERNPASFPLSCVRIVPQRETSDVIHQKVHAVPQAFLLYPRIDRQTAIILIFISFLSSYLLKQVLSGQILRV